MYNKFTNLKSFIGISFNYFSLVKFFRNVSANSKQIFQEHKNRQELLPLLKLDGHELIDMGLSREDIHCAMNLPLHMSSAKELNNARRLSKKL